MRVVENMQLLSARHARASFEGGPDFFGEEHLLLQLETFLTGRVPAARLAAQLARLKVADYALLPTPLGRLDKSGAVEFDLDDEPAAGDGQPVGDPIEPEAPAEELPTLQIEAAVLDQQHAKDLDLATPVGFVTAITKSGRTPAGFRRLHLVGACWRVPGVHYKTFLRHGSREPAEYELDARCSDCFPRDAIAPAAPDESCSDSSSSSTSPSGSDADE